MGSRRAALESIPSTAGPEKRSCQVWRAAPRVLRHRYTLISSRCGRLAPCKGPDRHVAGRSRPTRDAHTDDDIEGGLQRGEPSGPLGGHLVATWSPVDVPDL